MNLNHWSFNVPSVKLILNKLEDLNFLRNGEDLHPLNTLFIE